MEAATLDPNISEALAAVGQYLSDTIPPVQAVEPVATLLEQPAQLIVSEILEWISAQFQGDNRNVSCADYLFHAVSKLHYLTQLQLIPEQALAPYLDSVKQLLMDRCPPEDRRLLQENFGRLGMSDTATATPIGLILPPDEIRRIGIPNRGRRASRAIQRAPFFNAAGPAAIRCPAGCGLPRGRES